MFVSFFQELNKIKFSISTLTTLNCLLVKKLISKYYKKKIFLKSPNDLLIRKKKISGILQETLFKNNEKYLIIGIGLNVIKSPKIKNYPTTNLLEITKKNFNTRYLANQLKMDEYEFAGGVTTIAEFQMADLIRKVTVQKGLDPRDFVVFAFGGAGPVHMGVTARELGIKKVYIPFGDAAAVWCAFGAASADISHVNEKVKILVYHILMGLTHYNCLLQSDEASFVFTFWNR